MKSAADREKWILLVALTLIWGSSFILIKKSLLYYTPYQVGGLRVLIAGLLLLPLAVKHMKKFPRAQLKYLLIAAFSGNFIPMFLFPIAETRLSSSVAGIVNSMVPIFVIILGVLFYRTKTTLGQGLGTLISFVGVCILALGNQAEGQLEIVPLLLLLLATLLYAVNGLTVKTHLYQIEPKILSAFVFGFILTVPSALSLLVSGFFTTENLSGAKVPGMLYVAMLSVFGTGLAMMLNYRLLRVSSALFASTVTLLMPIVALFWGVIDGETITLLQIVGGMVIIAGLLLLRSSGKKQ